MTTFVGAATEVEVIAEEVRYGTEERGTTRTEGEGRENRAPDMPVLYLDGEHGPRVNRWCGKHLAVLTDMCLVLCRGGGSCQGGNKLNQRRIFPYRQPTDASVAFQISVISLMQGG